MVLTLYYNVETTMGQRSKLHWPNVVSHPWVIVVYNLEPALEQRGNAIWGDMCDIAVKERDGGERESRYMMEMRGDETARGDR